LVRLLSLVVLIALIRRRTLIVLISLIGLLALIALVAIVRGRPLIVRVPLVGLLALIVRVALVRLLALIVRIALILLALLVLISLVGRIGLRRRDAAACSKGNNAGGRKQNFTKHGSLLAAASCERNILSGRLDGESAIP
jgi:hypothetical protein